MKLATTLFCLTAAAAQAAPIDWRQQVDAFDNVFRPHPNCARERCQSWSARTSAPAR